MDFVEGSVHLRQWKTSNRNSICSMSLELSLHDFLVFTSFIAENCHCHVRAEETSSKRFHILGWWQGWALNSGLSDFSSWYSLHDGMLCHSLNKIQEHPVPFVLGACAPSQLPRDKRPHKGTLSKRCQGQATLPPLDRNKCTPGLCAVCWF